LKNISLPHIESVKIRIYNQPFLSEMSEFININGKTLKYLNFYTSLNDNKLLGKLFQSIAQCCKNLVDLSILYSSEVDQELMEIFNNCIKLESIKFRSFFPEKIDGDRILAVLNQTLPKKLKSIIINNMISDININSFDNLMKNWKGSKPFTIKFNGLNDGGFDKLIKKYQDLGFLN